MKKQIDQLLKQYHYLPEIIVFSIAFLTRFIRITVPPNFMFDEVYHAFTAQEMLKGNPAAWEWWNTPPTGMAYEWTHPPLAKEFMVIGMKLFGINAFGWRVFPALFGFGIIVLIYFITLKIFRNRWIALMAAFIASMDGLLLAMSRIAMNDSFFVFFALLALYLLVLHKKLLTGVALGLALASKWTGFYGIGIMFVIALAYIFLIEQRTKEWRRKLSKELLLMPVYLIIIPVVIYLAAYLPFFLGKPHIIPGANRIAPQRTVFEKLFLPPQLGATNWETFIQLQEQMWWYHTGLKATHAYQSRPWQWVLDLKSVWFYVDYKETSIANIYALGNPLVFWFGFVSILFMAWEYVKTRAFPLAIVLVNYFGYFLPWVLSPRIMFLYHYTPAVPFLAIGAAYILYQFAEDKIGRTFLVTYLVLTALLFIYFFPMYTGIHVPKPLNETYFWIKSWR